MSLAQIFFVEGASRLEEMKLRSKIYRRKELIASITRGPSRLTEDDFGAPCVRVNDTRAGDSGNGSILNVEYC